MQGPEGKERHHQVFRHLCDCVFVQERILSAVPVSVRLQVSPPKPSAQIQTNGSSPTPVTHVAPLWQTFTLQ